MIDKVKKLLKHLGVPDRLFRCTLFVTSTISFGRRDQTVFAAK